MYGKGNMVGKRKKVFKPRTEQPKGKQKYNNVRVNFEGISFDSKKELHRYLELKSMEKDGLIKDIECHPTFRLETESGKPIRYRGKGHNLKLGRQVRYIADFKYTRISDGKVIVEDVKSPITANLPAFKLKIAVLEALQDLWVEIIY